MRTAAEPYPARLFSIGVSIALSPDQTFERLLANTARRRNQMPRRVHEPVSSGNTNGLASSSLENRVVGISVTGAAPGRRLMVRLCIILLTIAVVIPVMSVQRVTMGLVAMAAVSWSFVVAIQIAVAVGVIMSARERRIDLVPALDLWFAGHLPYSLWMLAVAALATSSGLVDPMFLFATAVVPSAWTAWIVAAFCRRVLGNSPSTA